MNTYTVDAGELLSGAKILSIDVPEASSFALSVFARSGYRFAQEDQYELPHLLEHLAFEGNKAYPSARKFSYAMERLGAYYNANTDRNLNEYEFNGNTGDSTDIVTFAVNQIIGPLFREKAIRQEKQTIANELSPRIEDPSAGYVSDQLILPSLPSYESRIAVLSHIERKDILDFYRQHYVSKNLFFVLSGDISRKIEQIRYLINKKLSSYLGGEMATLVPLPLLDYRQKIHVMHSIKKQISTFYLNFLKSGEDMKSWPALAMIQVLYNSGSAARMQEARKAGLSYGVSSGYSCGGIDFSDFYVSDAVKPEQLLPLFDLCMRELSCIAKGDYAQWELDRARGYCLGKGKRNLEIPKNYVDFHGRSYALRLDTKTSPEFYQEIAALTREDIKKVAKSYFFSGDWCLVLKGDELFGREDAFREVMEKYF